MAVIDVQVHPFDLNYPGRPWASPSHGLSSATDGEMVAAMKNVGVDGAIMIKAARAGAAGGLRLIGLKVKADDEILCVAKGAS